MSGLFEAPLSWFDIVALAVIVVSAVMSLGRGLIREAFSVISFVIGGLAAYFAVVFLTPPLADVLPDSWGAITPSAILVVVGFLAAYSIAAFVGGRLSRLIHASPEIGVLDRIAGAAFGVARGALAIMLFILLMHQVVPDPPVEISKSRSYALLNPAAEWIRKTIPGIVERAAGAATIQQQNESGGADQ